MDLLHSPLFDMTLCWARRCKDLARHSRQVGTEAVRLCDEHVEAFDLQVAADLQRLREAAAAPFPAHRKESA